MVSCLVSRLPRHCLVRYPSRIQIGTSILTGAQFTQNISKVPLDTYLSNDCIGLVHAMAVHEGQSCEGDMLATPNPHQVRACNCHIYFVSSACIGQDEQQIGNISCGE